MPARLCDSLLTDRTQLKRCSLAFEVRPAKAVQLLPDSLSAPGTSAPGTQLPRREPAATRAGHSQAAPAGSSVDQQAGESGAPGNSAFGARFRPLLPTGRETPSPLWAAPHCLFVNRTGVQVSSFSFQLVYDGAMGTRVTAPSFLLFLGSGSA